MLIGNRIKELRKARKMSLTELSQKSGVQIATLSRIENGKMTGTLDSHMHIAKIFGIELTELYSNVTNREESKNAAVTTPKSITDVFVHTEKSSYEILTTKILSKKMMPVLLKIEPQGKTNPEQNQPGTEKFLFVLEGKIKIEAGEQSFELTKYHTLYFDASLRHSLSNPGKQTARILCVVTPVAL